MEAATKLSVIDTATGEVREYGGCPQCDRMQAEGEEMDRKFKGLLLENRQLKADKHAELWGAPERPAVELLHAVHAAATKAAAASDKERGVELRRATRRKALDSKELEQGMATYKALGLLKCLEAICGIVHDPGFGPPRKNGSRECFNHFELALRTTGHAERMAERIPTGWKPDLERVAEIGGVSVEWVRELVEGKPK